MAYKTNSLFHFTRDIDTIISILEHGFIPFYNKEQIDDLFGFEEELFDSELIDELGSSTFPMVCFCDIPLTSIKEHKTKYGGIAIGMKQSWGLHNGLTPLWYYSSEMPIYTEMRLLVAKVTDSREYQMSKEVLDGDSLYLQTNALNYLRLMKTYSKPMIIRKDDKVTRYYLENEWRFVPNKNVFEDTTGKSLFIWEEQMNLFNKDIRDDLKSAFKLKLDIKDIEYIIVDNKSDIEILIKKIRDWSKERKYKEESIDLLLTKIISLSHISADF
ncbi:abortive infection system antitoxin AbiGi family protein [Candidatus Xianfuyuplasma coldseepsis]|uniref:Uncharacterized protein n=1 Tax=Candidatus Xianfuyuplasma coldseepsis TaxID=2782163 RepID=A0A7L7KRK5_9MOLU|nr:abortive infection system antitoxin AbiGi family protein [Xianfuyuplasma coldseepsis]QMS84836.1 hypothetical protein G4Z02_03395 [Xianfuyuplasma coldseepsis]